MIINPLDIIVIWLEWSLGGAIELSLCDLYIVRIVKAVMEIGCLHHTKGSATLCLGSSSEPYLA